MQLNNIPIQILPCFQYYFDILGIVLNITFLKHIKQLKIKKICCTTMVFYR